MLEILLSTVSSEGIVETEIKHGNISKNFDNLNRLVNTNYTLAYH